MKHQRIAALTGGIASGKSTVARIFRELGAAIIDADVVARQVVEPGEPAWQEIVAHFGSEILFENQQIHRAKLGAIIFQNAEERQILNQIVHPRVAAEIRRQEEYVLETSPQTLIITDIPLLIETSRYLEYSTVIVTYIPEELQQQRLMERDKISAEDAQKRIQSQMPLAEKRRYATHIINNDGDIEITRQHVCAVYQELLHL